ncbi:MAG: ABC transporter substrate-binding protein [Bauldia sp.]|nr:ABC transporter substrate-binding protein [Bauldia sp.]
MKKPLIGAAAAALAGIGIAIAANSASVAQTPAPIPIRFSLDWNFEGPAAPFLLALENGYFAEEGLLVTIDSASGSLEPINRVASGTYDMGFGDINSLIKFRDANPTVGMKAVYMVYNYPAFAIVGRRSLGIETPADLEGRTLGAPAPDGAYAQWPIFVQANGIDASRVAIENVGFPVREPMLAAGEVDAVTGFSFSSYFNLIRAGVPADDINVMLMAEYGVNLYGNAIIVGDAFAEANPEAVAAFLRAFTRALQETIADPAAAAAYVVAANPVADLATETARLQMAIDQNILTDEVVANGFGGVDMARLATAIDQIALTYTFTGALPAPETVFDTQYLPDAALRAVE